LGCFPLYPKLGGLGPDLSGVRTAHLPHFFNRPTSPSFPFLFARSNPPSQPILSKLAQCPVCLPPPDSDRVRLQRPCCARLPCLLDRLSVIMLPHLTLLVCCTILPRKIPFPSSPRQQRMRIGILSPNRIRFDTPNQILTNREDSPRQAQIDMESFFRTSWRQHLYKSESRHPILEGIKLKNPRTRPRVLPHQFEPF
jgi:hypothetical protein